MFPDLWSDPQAEHSGIIRAGARFVEAMATALVPKIVLTVNHASGAGYYAMAGQGFDPDFIFSWPTGRMGVMEGDSAVQAVFGSELEKLRAKGEEPGEELEAEMQKVRETYERDLDAKYAAARGFVDAVIAPEDDPERAGACITSEFELFRTASGPVCFTGIINVVCWPQRH